jgi:hypothetical protein
LEELTAAAAEADRPPCCAKRSSPSNWQRKTASDQRRAAKDLESAQAAAKRADSTYRPLSPQSPATSTGRRLALAQWLTNPQNPLTARVAVNHVWLRHFGQPLVAAMDDFGRRTPRPRQAALLDWLAVEFMENGWSLKHLHRLIVTSNAYRMASATRERPRAICGSIRTTPGCGG